MPRNVRIVPNRAGLRAFRQLIGRKTAAVLLDAETEAKRETPVHGGYRSFRPGEKPIGGTLRRSVHSVVYVDAARIGGHSEDGKPPLPEEGAVPGKIVGYVGTNTGYGGFVDQGTSAMPAREFLAPGLRVAAARAPATMARVR